MKVKCIICGSIIDDKDFAKHATSQHKPEVFNLITEYDIVNGLAEWTEDA